MAPIDRELYRATLLSEIRAAWHTLRELHTEERFYLFGVYTAPLAEYVMATAATEEGLALATERYLAKYGGDPELRRAALRFSFADSPLHAEGEALLPKSVALRDAGPDPYDDSPEAQATVELVFEVAVDVLAELDREGLFGVADERAGLVLGIWIGDQSDEERLDFVRRLNPETVCRRFEREVDAANRAFLAL